MKDLLQRARRLFIRRADGEVTSALSPFIDMVRNSFLRTLETAAG